MDKKIGKYLDIVYNEVVKGFNNAEIKELLRKECYIAGGCIRSLLLDEKINDYDFFFRSKEAATRFKELIKLGEEGKLKATPLAEVLETGDKYHKKHMFHRITTDNAITFKLYSKNLKDEKSTVQFVTKFSGAPYDLIDKFDFTHSMAFYDPLEKENELQYSSLFLGDNRNKILRFNKRALTPIHSLSRIDKFTKKGYHIKWGDLKVLIQQVNAQYTNKDIEKYTGTGVY